MGTRKPFRCGDHVCAIYSGVQDLAGLASSFLAEGLRNGERCWYVAADGEGAAVSAALRKRGVAVRREIRRGALNVFVGSDAYVRRGGFDPERTVEGFNNAIEQALNEGFTGFRAAADMSWALRLPNGAELLIAYEAMLRTLFASCRVVGLCLYDRQRMPLKVLNGALVTHPIAGCAAGGFCDNALYDSTITALPDADDDVSVLAKLSALESRPNRRSSTVRHAS